MAVRADPGTAAEQRDDRNAGVTRMRGTFIKFGIFGVVMVLLTAFLFATFAEVRTGSINDYSAVFKDASRLETGTRCASPASGWAPCRRCPCRPIAT